MNTEQLTTAEFTPAQHGGRVVAPVDITAMIPRLDRYNFFISLDRSLSDEEHSEYEKLRDDLAITILVRVLVHAESVGAIVRR